MHRVKSAFFLTILLAVIFPAQTAFAQPAEEAEKTRKDIYSAWTAYLNSLKSFSGRKEQHLTCSDGSKEDSAREFFVSPPYILSVFSDGGADPELVGISNPKYYARVRYDGKRALLNDIVKLEDSDRLGGDWFDNEELNENLTLRCSKSRTNNRIIGLLGDPLRIFPFWLPGLLKDERFTFAITESVQDGGRRTAVVSFAGDPPIRVSPIHEMLEVKLTLMPEHYWLPVRAECLVIECGEEIHVTLENEYDFHFSVPVLTRQIRKIEGAYTGEEVITVTGIKENITIDPKDFTLTRWGLPEPEFGVSPEDLVRVILISLGSVFVAAALVRFYRKRRPSVQ